MKDYVLNGRTIIHTIQIHFYLSTETKAEAGLTIHNLKNKRLLVMMRSYSNWYGA